MKLTRLVYAALFSLTVMTGCTDAETEAFEGLESTQAPIVGGTVETGHPAVGALISSSGLCTGTLIAPKLVLTAAHCLGGGTINWFVTGPDMYSQPMFKVKQTFAHPDYDDSVYEHWNYVGHHDIAVAVLENAVTSITPMAYRSTSLSGSEGSTITFVGYGNQGDPSYVENAGEKMKVTATIGDIWSQGFWNYTNSSNPKMTCSGDSGGPALMWSGGVEQVVGVVSSGDAHCESSGYNTRVDTNATWIAGKVSAYGGSVSACGNGTCDSGETSSNCPADCGAVQECGYMEYVGCCNGTKLMWCEDNAVQTLDCNQNLSCGWSASDGYYNCGTDGAADPSGENPKACTALGPQCGNGTCETGETQTSCPADCTPAEVCGNGKCLGSETAANCPQDCGPVCGDGKCDSGETASSCAADCKTNPVCGNGTCEDGETVSSCLADCKPLCGNGLCENGETSTSCLADCKATCGNGQCETGENSTSCLADCKASCGNGKCEAGETNTTCLADCKPECGNDLCENGETAASCSADCADECGNKVCDQGETVVTCPSDCTAVGPYCGNGLCGGTENCSTCPADCGECEPGEEDAIGEVADEDPFEELIRTAGNNCSAGAAGGAVPGAVVLLLGLFLALAGLRLRRSFRS